MTDELFRRFWTKHLQRNVIFVTKEGDCPMARSMFKAHMKAAFEAGARSAIKDNPVRKGNPMKVYSSTDGE